VDPQIIALSIPVVSAIMALISTRLGNPHTACLFVEKEQPKK